MEKQEVVEKKDFMYAIKRLNGKFCRKVKNGYEAYVSVKGKTIFLGTHGTESEAKKSAMEYKIQHFIDSAKELGLNPYEGVVYKEFYVIFPSGRRMNLQMGLEKRVTGENHHAHKLNAEKVRYIREHYRKRDKVFSGAALARKFKVDRSVIESVVAHKTWRDIE